MYRYFPPTWITDKLPDGFTGINYFWGIKMRPDLPAFVSIYAQEVFEWRVRFAIFIATALLAAVIFPYALPLAMLTPSLTRVPFIERYLELRGHTITALLCNELYGWQLQLQLETHAHKLKTSYRGFRGMTEPEIAAKMYRLIPEMRKWTRSWPWRKIIR